MVRRQRRRTRESTSHQQGEYLSDDLVLEIQMVLPPKSLLKFKCVSRHWRDRISSPSFLDMHEKKSKKNPILLCRKNVYHERAHSWRADWNAFDTKSYSFTNSFTTKYKVYDIMISCLGLICFKGSKNDGDRHYQIFLYNPSTKHILALPKDNSLKFPEDPIRGFAVGYLPSTRTYKVVQLFDPRSDDFKYIIKGPLKCEVVEVTNSVVHGNGISYYSNWRMVEDCPHLADFLLSPAFIEDTMYWESNFLDLIVCFNIKNEKFGTVNYPNTLQSEATGKTYNLMDLEGQLAIASLVNPCIEIWKLQDHSGSVW